MEWIGLSCPTSTRESNGHRGAVPASADGFDREKRTGPRRMARGLPPPGRARGTSGRGPGKGVLADTRWGDGGRVHGELQMLEDFPDDLAVMAAMIRSVPCWQNGQRAMSRAKTRFSSR